jgi:hypothetical protein
MAVCTFLDSTIFSRPDRKNGINLIPSRYHWDQLDAKVIVLDINFPVRDGSALNYSTAPHRSKTTLISNGVFCLLESKILSIGQTLLYSLDVMYNFIQHCFCDLAIGSHFEALESVLLIFFLAFASKKYDQTDSRAPKCVARVTKIVMYIVNITFSRIVIFLYNFLTGDIFVILYYQNLGLCYFLDHNYIIFQKIDFMGKISRYMTIFIICT